jgi:hypothetical protein
MVSLLAIQPACESAAWFTLLMYALLRYRQENRQARNQAGCNAELHAWIPAKPLAFM